MGCVALLALEIACINFGWLDENYLFVILVIDSRTSL